MSSRAAVVIGGMTRLLEDRNAIIYGGGGAIGGAAARVFAREGATVHLAGRTREPLERVAAAVAADGGSAEVAVLDALDEAAVDSHADAVAAAGGIDVSFNLVARGDAQGTPIAEMPAERFLHAPAVGLRTQFLTARAAARHMLARGSGVLLHLTSASAAGAQPGMGNTGPADAAVEALMRYLAAELGPGGIRVAGIHTAAVRGTLTRANIKATSGFDVDPEAVYAGISGRALLRRPPELAEIAETAAFLASDRAGAITSGIVNATAGLVVG
jgi:NAD(P)-dependent dehydrogenase (short-subunit alcohol dehydrogenase family)